MYEIFCIKLAHDNTQCKYQTHSTLLFFHIKVHDTTQNKPMYLMNLILILKTESQTLHDTFVIFNLYSAQHSSRL